MADDDPFAKYKKASESGDPFAKYAAAPKLPSEPADPNIGTSFAAPIVNTLDYPIRAAGADIYGLAKGGVPTDEKSRESFYGAREKALKATEIPESETGRTISGALSFPGEMVGAGIKSVSEAVLGPETTAALGPYATMGGDVAPLAGGLTAALRPRNPATMPTAAAQAARAAGFRLPPEEIMRSPPLGSRFLSGHSGKYKKQQAFSEINQERANQLAAKTIGLPPDTTLSETAFAKAKQPAIDTYDTLKTTHPNTVLAADMEFQKAVQGVGVHNQAMEQFFPKAVHNPGIVELRKQLLRNDIADTEAVMKQIADYRFEARQNFRKRDDAMAHSLGAAQLQAASVLEDAIERSIGYGPARVELFDKYAKAKAAPKTFLGKEAGVLAEAQKELMNSLATMTPAERAAATAQIEKYQGARQLFAKIYDVENAVRSDGNIVPSRVKALRTVRGKPLTGELKAIADAAESFPKEMQDPATFGRSEQFSVLDIIGGTAALAAGHPEAAGLIMGRPLSRALMTSRPYQRHMFNRTPTTNSPTKATLAGEALTPKGGDSESDYDPLAGVIR